MSPLIPPLAPIDQVIADASRPCAVVLCFFTVAAVTDFLDGWLARRWGQITAVGSFLDPLADKVLVNGMAIRE